MNIEELDKNMLHDQLDLGESDVDKVYSVLKTYEDELVSQDSDIGSAGAKGGEKKLKARLEKLIMEGLDLNWGMEQASKPNAE